MTGTGSLNGGKVKVGFGYTVLKSLVYGIPPPATQKNGPTPLRDLLNSIEGPGTEPLEMTDTNDDRMQQSVFTDGTLWSTIGTIIRPHGRHRGPRGHLLVPGGRGRRRGEREDQGEDHDSRAISPASEPISAIRPSR